MPVTTRRDFLKLGTLFVPVVTAPTVAYSFLWQAPSRALIPRAFDILKKMVNDYEAAGLIAPVAWDHIVVTIGGRQFPGTTNFLDRNARAAR